MIKIENIEQFVKYATSLNYRYAKTFTNFAPHEYAMAKDNTKELEIIRSLNKYIQEHGEKEMYYRTEFDVLFAGEYKYWSMDYWANTYILNRNWDRKREDGTIDKSYTEARKENGDNK